MKALILYYFYGGNTNGIAQRIKKDLGCDIAEIQPVKPYPQNFDAVVDQGEEEIKRGYEPEIKPLDCNPADYDIIILGTPVWWYTFAPPVKTVLSSVNWTGKTVYPFTTNAGWIGHTFKDIQKACSGADVKSGFNIRFDEERLITSQSEIDKWRRWIL
ncbi:MAG TPA: flavodoxin [Bacillota bacterium]|nr:flavodoxin [Bacillota bacterium]